MKTGGLKLENKGQSQQIFFILLMAGLLAGIILFFYVYTLAVPFISKTTNEIISTTNDIAGTDNTENGNITENLKIATAPVTGINQFLSWFGYLMFFGLLIAFLIIAYNVRSHPYLAVFWIFIIAVLALVSMWLSNSYEEIKYGDSYLRDAYESNVISNFLMTYLPHIVVAFGLISGLLLFVLISRDPEMEATYV